jgi:hypothetical protein
MALIYGTIVGLLLGLAYCYWKSINVAYQNRGLINAGSNVIDDVQNLFSEIKQKI